MTDPSSTLPPEEVEYHCIDEPVAARSAIVWLDAEQKDCAEAPVGASGLVINITATSNRVVLSQPVTVCVA